MIIQYDSHWNRKFQIKTGPFSFFSYLVLKELAICHKEKVLLKPQSSSEKLNTINLA